MQPRYAEATKDSNRNQTQIVQISKSKLMLERNHKS